MSISYAVFCLQKQARPRLAPGERSRYRGARRRPDPLVSNNARASRRPRPRSALFLKHPATPKIFPLSLHDALPISPILVTDTVGFIKKLPHDLVASFRSTLDEVV